MTQRQTQIGAAYARLFNMSTVQPAPAPRRQAPREETRSRPSAEGDLDTPVRRPSGRSGSGNTGAVIGQALAGLAGSIIGAATGNQALGRTISQVGGLGGALIGEGVEAAATGTGFGQGLSL